MLATPTSDSLIVVSKPGYCVTVLKRETATDSLEWAYRTGQYRRKTTALKLLQQFPQETGLLRVVVNHYRDEKDCDSLRYWGRRLNDNVVKHLNTLLPPPDSSYDVVEGEMALITSEGDALRTLLDFLHADLKRICGDTTVYK